MVVDPVAAIIFSTQQEDPLNKRCADSGVEDAAWASVSHGIYISIGASGIHRSLGVKVSFVQSTTMDSWKPVHLRMMELGGNQRFQAFMDEHGIQKDMPIREKYQTRAAAWYRENLRALAEGREPPEPLPAGTGHLPSADAADASQQVLDQVFAKAPCATAMTTGGVPVASRRQRQLSNSGGRSRKAKKCALASFMQGGKERMVTASTAVADLPEQLWQLFSGKPTAEGQEEAARSLAAGKIRSRSRSNSPPSWREDARAPAAPRSAAVAPAR